MKGNPCEFSYHWKRLLGDEVARWTNCDRSLLDDHLSMEIFCCVLNSLWNNSSGLNKRRPKLVVTSCFAQHIDFMEILLFDLKLCTSGKKHTYLILWVNIYFHDDRRASSQALAYIKGRAAKMVVASSKTSPSSLKEAQLSKVRRKSL